MQTLIAGAGIAGLTTALSLHAAGLTNLTVYATAAEFCRLGAGENLLLQMRYTATTRRVSTCRRSCATAGHTSASA